MSFAPVARIAEVPAALADRLRRYPARRRLLGDPEVVPEHLRVAAGLTGLASLATVLVGTLGLVVSPAVWDALVPLGIAGLLALALANAYWRGGPLVGYALAFGPLGGGAAGATAAGHVGLTVPLVGAVLGLAVAVPAVHLLGAGGRRLREAIG